MELNAGSAGITFPNLSMTGTIEANAGAVRLCAPPGVGLRIETGGNIAASYDFHDLVAGRVRLDLAWLRRRARPDRSPDRWHGRLVHAWIRREAAMDDRLYRSVDDRMLAGVAGGVAERLDADPSIIRVVWALLIILTGGLALVAYVVMAIVVPEAPA